MQNSATIKAILDERAARTSARRADEEEEGAEARVAVVTAATGAEKVVEIEDFKSMLAKEFESAAGSDALWSGIIDQ